MAFKIQVGLPQIAITRAGTVLISELDGQISSPSDKGLYLLDARVISRWSIYASGTSHGYCSMEAVTPYAARMRNAGSFGRHL